MKNKLKQFIKKIFTIKRVGIFGALFLFGLFGIYILSANVVNAGNCSITNMGACIREGLTIFVSQLFIWVGGTFLELTAYLMQFLVEIGSYNGYLDSTVVQIGWTVVRDFVNVFFVIVLLVIAIATILGIEQYEWKKLLGKFALAAILINFSHIIAGFIIDISQVIQMTFLSAIAANNTANLSNLKIQDIQTLRGQLIENGTLSYDVALGIMASAMAASIFAFMAMVSVGIYTIILLMRMVTLWVLIVLSPLAFVLGVLPQTQKFSSRWWSEFSNNVLMGPVIIFFLWLSFVAISSGDVYKEVSISGNAGFIEGTGSLLIKLAEYSNLSSFLIAIGILMAGVKVSQEVGGEGANLMNTIKSSGVKFARYASGWQAAKWGAPRLAKYGAMNAPIIGGRNWRRLGWRLNDIRKGNKWIKHIPIIGGAGGEKHEKMDKRVQKAVELNKETRLKTMSDDQDLAGILTGNLVGLKATSKFKTTAEDNNMMAMLQSGKKEEMKKAKAMAKFEPLAAELINESSQEVQAEFLESQGLSPDLIKEREEAKKKVNITDDEVKEKMRGKDVQAEINDRVMEKIDGMTPEEQEKLGDDTQNTKLIKQEKAKKEKEIKAQLEEDKIRDAIGTKKYEQYQQAAEALPAYLGSEAGMDALVDKIKPNGLFNNMETSAVRNAAKAQIYSLKQQEAQGKADQRLSEQAMADTGMGRAMLGRIADLEVGKTIADDFIKQIKNARLGEEFAKANKKLESAIEKGIKLEDIKEELKSGKGQDFSDPYTRSLLQAQLATAEENKTSLQRNIATENANDLAVNIPKYGAASASTALIEVSKRHFSELDRMDVDQAKEKAAEEYAHFQYLKSQGEELDIDQKARSHAVAHFIRSQSYADDQQGYTTNKLQKLFDGDLDGEDEEKWEAASASYEKLKWVEKDKYGNRKLTEKAGKYNTGTDQDMAMLADFGFDAGAVATHHKITAKLKATGGDLESELQKVDDEFAKQLEQRRQELIIHLREQAVADGSYSPDTFLDKANATVDEIMAEDQEVHNEEKAKKKEKKVKEFSEGRNEKYWEAAKSANDMGAGELDHFKELLKNNATFLQDSAKEYKNYALANGHTNHYSIGYDNSEGLFRPLTEGEAEATMHSERIKKKPGTLISGDHMQSLGDTDTLTGLITNLKASVMESSYGRVNKLWELNNVYERTAKASMGIAPDESAEVKNGMAQFGSKALREEMKRVGVTLGEGNEELAYIMKNYLLANAQAGSFKGYGLQITALFKHLKEDQALAGFINTNIGGNNYGHQDELLKDMLKVLKGKPDMLDGTRYEGKGEMLKIKIQNEIKTVTQAKTEYLSRNKNNAPGDTTTPGEQNEAQESQEAGR